ncbi:hypothetical protein H4219_003491 [Mycoemilia scoparia]|uniref:Metallo-beta-lactamase domain-containing protein n=1 Tax=Mycoemilia scoparia TaxID=417184 RepID=A0A9W7ZUS1_9FUNG|nr:hypothetical protein H4219_003491 [Mycoemilia scoparia]
MFLCELPETTFVVNCGWEPNDLVYTDNPKGDDPNEDGDNMEGLNAIDWGLVDFILISNYENMGLLPWISEYTSFQGDIFVTEPTKSYGKCLVEERILLSSLWSGHENAMPQIPSTSKVGGLSQSHTEIMKPPYTLHDVTQCFEKISDVRYNQVIKPLMTVSIHAQSSGYCIGSANWVVDYKGEKIAFISASSFAEQLHPQELDKSVVKNSSIVVVSDLDTRTDTSDTSKSFYWLGKIASNIVNTVKQKANTIVVSRPLGLVNDLLQMTAEMIRHRALVSPQYLFISPIASKTMQLGNIMGEWLNRSKQDALYIPEYPFIERELRLDNSLRYLKSVADLSITPLSPEPCVAFMSMRGKR